MKGGVRGDGDWGIDVLRIPARKEPAEDLFAVPAESRSADPRRQAKALQGKEGRQ